MRPVAGGRWRLASHRRRRARRARARCGRGRARIASRSSRRRTSVDYKPRSTLVVPSIRCRARSIPVIDIHSHQPAPISDAQFETLVKSMDPLNLQVLVNATGVSGDRLVQQRGGDPRQPVQGPDGDVHATSTSATRRSDLASASGRRSSSRPTSRPARSASARSTRSFGLRIRKSDGSRLKIDDPELDPDLADGGAAEHPGPHSHRRSAGVLPADQLHQRALAGAGALSGSPVSRRRSFRRSRS